MAWESVRAATMGPGVANCTDAKYLVKAVPVTCGSLGSNLIPPQERAHTLGASLGIE